MVGLCQMGQCLKGQKSEEMIGAESEPVGEKRKMELKRILQRSRQAGDWM